MKYVLPLLFATLCSLPARAQHIHEVHPLGISPGGEDYAPVFLDSGFGICSVRDNAALIGFVDSESGKPLSDLYYVPFAQGKAGALCGIAEVLFMGEEDGFLQSTRALRYRVTREIRRIRPQLIICTDPDRYFVGEGYINHPDHRNAGLVAIDAIFPASDNLMFYPELTDEGYPPHKINQLYIFGHAQPNVRVDITDDIETKINAILCHKTQITNPSEAVPAWRERWGQPEEDGSVRYHEHFKVMKFT